MVSQSGHRTIALFSHLCANQYFSCPEDTSIWGSHSLIKLYTGVPKKIHILRDVTYVLLFKVELSYGSNVEYDVCSKDGINQMNVSIMHRITVLIQFYAHLKCVYIYFGTLCIT